MLQGSMTIALQVSTEWRRCQHRGVGRPRASFPRLSETGSCSPPWHLFPLTSDGHVKVLLLLKSSMSQELSLSGGASFWKAWGCRGSDSFIPDHHWLCPQVLSLRDPGTRSQVDLASGLSCWLLLTFGYPDPHAAPMSQGHLPRETWCTQC